MEHTERSFCTVEAARTAVLNASQAAEPTEVLPLVTEFLMAAPLRQSSDVSPRETGEPVNAEQGETGYPVEQLSAEETTAAQWIQEERDTFDWQGIAALAAKQNEEQRATDEWASTNWDASILITDHVAAVLLKIAKRVQKGELKVDAERSMSPEAILAAALSALLRSEET